LGHCFITLIDTGEEGSLGGQSAWCTDTHVQDAAIRDESKHVTARSPACAPGWGLASRATLPVTFHPTPILPLCWRLHCSAWMKRNLYAWESISSHVSAGGWCWCLPRFLKLVSSCWKFKRCLHVGENAGVWRRGVWTRETGEVCRDEQARRGVEKAQKPSKLKMDYLANYDNSLHVKKNMYHSALWELRL